MYGQKENISLPSGLANQLKHLYGPDARIVAQAPVGGGDINEAYHLVLHRMAAISSSRYMQTLQPTSSQQKPPVSPH